MAKIFKVVVRARIGVQMVAEIEVARCTVRVDAEAYLERAADYKGPVDAANFLRSFYPNNILEKTLVTVELKFD